jgi:RNA-binding protein YlmH
MLNKELILKKVNKTEDKLFVAKLLDKAQRAEKQKCLTYSDFLDPHQRTLAEMIFSGCDEVDYYFYGGYPGAERVLIFFLPDFMSSEENVSPGNDLFSFLKLTVGTRESLSHRDYLGSLMSIGIKREKTGDILVGNDGCFIIVLKEISDFIKYNLEKVSNVKVDIKEVEEDELEVPESKVKEIRTTVPSLRLDSVSSAGFGISRSKIAELIKNERLSLNWETTDSVTKQVKEGDTISIRGKGKVVLEKIEGKTRKDRIFIILKKFV